MATRKKINDVQPDIPCIFSNDRPLGLKQGFTLIEIPNSQATANEKHKHLISFSGRNFKIDSHPYDYKPDSEIDKKDDSPFAFLAQVLSGDYKRTDAALSVLQKALSSNDLILSELISQIDEAASLVNALKLGIDKAFILAGLDRNNLFSPSDLKQPKHGKSIREANRAIDQNINHFLKTKKINAGLAYLQYRISLIQYGFGLDIINDWGDKIKQFKFYTSHVVWHYWGDEDFDASGDVLNKIAEHLFLMLNETGFYEPIAETYNALSKYPYLKLKTDVLLRIINALIKNEAIELLEPAIKEFKTREPQHPVIDEANRTIRRMEVFDQISRSGNTGFSGIQNMDGIEFERFLENQFTLQGFKVYRTKASGDFGADLIIEMPSGTKAAVQAKRFKHRVNLKAVQEVVASIRHYVVDFGIVITTSVFLQSAIDLAKSNDVELWDEDKLVRFLSGDLTFSKLNE
jgi:hypothetical protein